MLFTIRDVRTQSCDMNNFQVRWLLFGNLRTQVFYLYFAPFKSVIDLLVIAHTPRSYIDVHANRTTKNVPFLCCF